MATGQLLPAIVARLAPNPPNWGAQQRRVAPVDSLIAPVSLIFGGVRRVDGTVKVAGSPDVPVSRVVLLIHASSGRIAHRTFSDASGGYSFPVVGPGPWMVISRDHTGEYNAVIADNIYGEPM